MKKSIFKRGLSKLMEMLLCCSGLVNIGTTTAFAAGTETEVYLIAFPRDGDENYRKGTWGHENLTYMNGWSSSSSRQTIVRTVGTYNGPICYCIEPGVPLNIGDKLTQWDEGFWDNYPSSYNKTITPDDIKLLIGRIMQYGYTGTVSTSWRSQNSADANKLSHAMATQLLIWVTVVGERDADFNKVSTGGYAAVLDQISSDHPPAQPDHELLQQYRCQRSGPLQAPASKNYPACVPLGTGVKSWWAVMAMAALAPVTPSPRST